MHHSSVPASYRGSTRSLLISSVLFCLALSWPAPAQIIVPGADGSDGNFVPLSNTQIDLSLAVPRDWDVPSPVAGRGVYDPIKWAVVFKYASVNIPVGVTVTFKNHPSGAPVVWLVQDSVVVNGTVSLNGADGHGDGSVAKSSAPGPGGFRGGRGKRVASPGSGGYGPGGASLGNGTSEGSGAGYATQGRSGNSGFGTPGQTYGNAGLIPLIGGSGGAGGESITGNIDAGGGGAGGGAILIAAPNLIRIDGTLRANGGFGAGNWTGGGASGGAIRLIADMVIGDGSLQAFGAAPNSNAGAGGNGRIRIEANAITLTGGGDPVYTSTAPGATAVLWTSPNVPSVRILSLGGQAIPTDPRASLDVPGADVTVPNQGSQLVTIEAENVPIDWALVVRMVPPQGQDMTAQAAYVSGDESLSIWQATLPLPAGFTVLQARAYQQAPTTANLEPEADPTTVENE